jgi:hypothetical protein
VDKVFNTNTSFLGQGRFDDLVVGDGDSGFVNFQKTSLVDQIFDGLKVGDTESDVGFNFSQHVDGGGVHSDQGGVVNLSQSQKS